MLPLFGRGPEPGAAAPRKSWAGSVDAPPARMITTMEVQTMIATDETTTMAPDNGQIKAPSRAGNAEIIAACGRYFELQRHFDTYGEEDIPDDDPALPEQAALIKSLALRRLRNRQKSAFSSRMASHPTAESHHAGHSANGRWSLKDKNQNEKRPGAQRLAPDQKTFAGRCVNTSPATTSQ